MEDILNALRQIEPLGKFCAATRIPANALDIEIDTIGTLQWPLSQAQIELMLAQATPAPFGKR